jgi:hypothetical protein
MPYVDLLPTTASKKALTLETLLWHSFKYLRGDENYGPSDQG